MRLSISVKAIETCREAGWNYVISHRSGETEDTFIADFAVAMAFVEQFHQKAELTEQRLCRFAESGKFDETTAALSLLTELPVGAIERALVHDTGD